MEKSIRTDKKKTRNLCVQAVVCFVPNIVLVLECDGNICVMVFCYVLSRINKYNCVVTDFFALITCFEDWSLQLSIICILYPICFSTSTVFATTSCCPHTVIVTCTSKHSTLCTILYICSTICSCALAHGSCNRLFRCQHLHSKPWSFGCCTLAYIHVCIDIVSQAEAAPRHASVVGGYFLSVDFPHFHCWAVEYRNMVYFGFRFNFLCLRIWREFCNSVWNTFYNSVLST